LPARTVKEELHHFTMSRKIEIFDNYILVNNIADMQRIVDSRTNVKK
jgi:hypothetical protein